MCCDFLCYVLLLTDIGQEIDWLLEDRLSTNESFKEDVAKLISFGFSKDNAIHTLMANVS